MPLRRPPQNPRYAQVRVQPARELRASEGHRPRSPRSRRSRPHRSLALVALGLVAAAALLYLLGFLTALMRADVPLMESDARLNHGQRQNLAILHRNHPHHAAKRHGGGIGRIARNVSQVATSTTTHLRGPNTGSEAPAVVTADAMPSPSASQTTVPIPPVPVAAPLRTEHELVMCSSAEGHVAPAVQSLSNGQRLVVFAAAARPWRADVVMAAALFDPSHLEFLWGDHLVTKESAARAALEGAECEFGGGSATSPVALDFYTGPGDDKGYVTLSCALPEEHAASVSARELAIRLPDLSGAALPIPLCQHRVGEVARVQAKLCTHAVVYGSLVDPARDVRRVAEWVAYHAVLGVQAFQIYVRGDAEKTALRAELDRTVLASGGTLRAKLHVEVVVFPRIISLEAIEAAKAARKAEHVHVANDVAEYFDQMVSMAHCVMQSTHAAEWVGVADVDEYWHVGGEGRDGALAALLSNVEKNIDAVSARNGMFGVCQGQLKSDEGTGASILLFVPLC